MTRQWLYWFPRREETGEDARETSLPLDDPELVARALFEEDFHRSACDWRESEITVQDDVGRSHTYACYVEAVPNFVLRKLT